MTQRHKPSDPRNHTREMLEKALSPSGKKSTFRTIEQRLPAVAPKPKRELERENLTKDGSVTRDRVKAPFTLPAVLRGNLEAVLTDMKNAGKFNPEKQKRIIPEASQRLTRLDKALEEHESYALAQYVEDRALESSTVKIGNYGGGHGGTPPWDRAPMAPKTQKALARLAHVHKYLNRDDRDDLRLFSRMCVPIDDFEPMTCQELGFRVSSSEDKRVCEGAFVGAVRKLAQRLYWLYKSYATTNELLGKTTQSRGITSATTCHSLAA